VLIQHTRGYIVFSEMNSSNFKTYIADRDVMTRAGMVPVTYSTFMFVANISIGSFCNVSPFLNRPHMVLRKHRPDTNLGTHTRGGWWEEL
jgi:hypothetical protein